MKAKENTRAGNSPEADKHLRHNSLVPYLRTFATSLLEYGYTDGTIHSKLWLLGDLERWLRRTKLAVTHLDERFLEAFLKHKRRVRRGEAKTLQPFLDHLRKLAIVPGRKVVRDQSPLADILNRYETYLCSERGLVTVTILHYQDFVRKFLLERFREGPFRLGEIKPSDISDFVLRNAHSMAVKRAQLMTTAFRSFFRFLFQKGELQANLAAAVPTVADWRLSTVPKHLTPEEVESVLKACNRAAGSGRRDYAVLLLLARLGLRAGEVVALQLDDINWRAGEITVRGKGVVSRPEALTWGCGQGLGVLPAPRSSGLSNASSLRLHEGATPWLCRPLNPDDDRAPRPRPRGPTPRLQGSPLASFQSGDFHARCRGNDGRSRRSSSASSS